MKGKTVGLIRSILKKWGVLGVLMLSACTSTMVKLPDLNAALKSITGMDEPSYDVAYTDLNRDGLKDAVVLLKGRQWCGSGGCTMMIFVNDGDHYQFLSKSTVTSPPILLAPEQHNGWQDLVVWSNGKGPVTMRYDGRKYPRNPSMQASRKIKTGQVLIE